MFQRGRYTTNQYLSAFGSFRCLAGLLLLQKPLCRMLLSGIHLSVWGLLYCEKVCATARWCQEGCLFFRSAKDDWNVTAILGALGPSRFFFEEKESDIFSPQVFRYAHNRAAATTSGEDSREIFRENHGFHHPIFTNKCQQLHIWAGLTCMSELKGFSLSNMTGRLGPLTVHC